MSALLNATTSSFDVATPLVYLPSHLAHQINIATYIHIGTTTVLIWDIIDNLRNDFRLLFSLKFGIATAVYFLARISILAYSIGRAVLLTMPIGNCGTFVHALNGVLIVFVVCTTFFFYLRVCAVYAMNRYIVAFFGMVWLATIALSGTFAVVFSAVHIGPTQYCIEHVEVKFLIPTTIILLINDVLIYFAITWKVYHMFQESGIPMGEKLKIWVLGRSLPVYSKVILQDSGLYCLFILLTKGFLVLAINNFEPPTSVMFIICHVVLVNILSSRVFRNMKMSASTQQITSGSCNIPFDSAEKGRSNTYYESRITTASTYRPSSPELRVGVSRHSDLILDIRSTSSASIHDSTFDKEEKEEKRVSAYTFSNLV